jgi:uncharacterized protein YbjQ (UPF0145 family)
VGFFEPDEDEADPAHRIESCGIPVDAEARLQDLAVGSLFTSGLSVNEFALLTRLGPRPLAQVMGASVVRVGWQYLPALAPGEIVSYPLYGPMVTGRALQNRMTEASPSQVRNYRWHTEVVCELDVLTDAWNTARRRALERLVAEARQVGADAVVGVHLHRSDHDLGRGTIEYVVTGTAIRQTHGRASAWPVLSDLSVQGFWRLHSAGHEPVGLAATTSVVFASAPRYTRLRRLRTTTQNQELHELSHGFHAARATVRARLEGQVADVRGTGAVGVALSHSVHQDKLSLASALGSAGQRGWNRGSWGLPYYVSGRADVDRRGWVITMHAAGTAIRRRKAPSEPPVETQIRMDAR